MKGLPQRTFVVEFDSYDNALPAHFCASLSRSFDDFATDSSSCSGDQDHSLLVAL